MKNSIATKKSAAERKAEKEAESYGKLVFVGVIAFLTAVGFSQIGWSEALGAVAGILLALAVLALTPMRPRLSGHEKQLEARIAALEEAIALIQEDRQEAPAGAICDSQNCPATTTAIVDPAREE